MITKVSTKEMTREQWLEARGKSIGGSDAACILGLNSYKSAYALWAEKTGKLVPEDISDKEAVRLGNDLEQYVAQRWMEATGKKVRRENHILYNDAYPFAHANPDRMVIGEDAGLECKTTSSWEIAQKLREGKIPDHWLCQMVHYMMVTGAKKWYLGALVFGTGFFKLELTRDEAEIAALASAEQDFWGLVTSDTPPAVDGSEATSQALKVIYKESAPGSSIDLTPVAQHISFYSDVCRQIDELENIRDEQANAIKAYMGEAEKGSWGNATVSWKSSTRKTFDKKAFEQANGPIDGRFYKVSETRTFRVNVKGA